MKCFIKYYFLPVVFYFLSYSGFAQRFSFQQYVNYRYNNYLDIPLPYLRSAAVHLQLGDTISAIKDVNKAIENGLYEPIRIGNNSQLASLKGRKAWNFFLKKIDNRRFIYRDPVKIKLHTSDIRNFFKFLPHINEPNAAELLMKDYILPGSPGLRSFFDLKLNSKPEVMIFKIRNSLKYYKSISHLESSIDNLLPSIKNAVNKLKNYYPNAIFPPFYFIIGIFNIAGTPDIGNGLLIGSEFFAAGPQTDTTQLSENEKFALYDTSRLIPVVIHELIHIEQKNPWGKNLLEQCIIEGACDFIASLILQKDINTRLHVYGDAHEKELWADFKKEIMTTDFSNWLYNGSKTKGTGVPPNLGYYVGYKICESYFKVHDNIKKTIADIIEIKNFEDFLSESGYDKKFY